MSWWNRLANWYNPEGKPLTEAQFDALPSLIKAWNELWTVRAITNEDYHRKEADLGRGIVQTLLLVQVAPEDGLVT